MFDEFNKWEKGLLVLGLMLLSFHVGGVVIGGARYWPEGYQKGLADCVRVNGNYEGGFTDGYQKGVDDAEETLRKVFPEPMPLDEQLKEMNKALRKVFPNPQPELQ